MQCQTCGMEQNGSRHQGVVDCIYAYRAFIAVLQQEVLNLKNQLPPGQVAIVSPIGRDVTARLWIEGEATVESIEQFQRVLNLMKDTYPLEADIASSALPRGRAEGGE